MNKSIRELLKEAHDHGYEIAKSNLDWSVGHSFNNFLRQNNIPLINSEEIKQQEAVKAIRMQAEGFTLREIASLLGYNHPQSIRQLIKRYGTNNNTNKGE